MSETHSGDLGLGHPSETSVEVQVLPASQELIDGVELRAVAHVLVHVQYLCLNAGKANKNAVNEGINMNKESLPCLIQIKQYNN